MSKPDDPRDFAVGVVALNGGRFVGKTRFQKTVYLIQKLAKVKLYTFDYHHYGPYSVELAGEVDSAVSSGRLKASESLGYYNIPYVSYATDESVPNQLVGKKSQELKRWLETIGKVDAVILELAATWAFLREEEDVPDKCIDSLLKQLKPQKAVTGKLRQAKVLLGDLGLSQS